jgi:hypothetical protein
MIPIEDDTSLRDDEDRQFDRLVDGELSEAQRRELLCRLDHQPDGWRRCALAFLEAQCWKQELQTVARPVTRPRRAAPQPRPQSTWTGRIGTVLAIAASLLIALTLGIQLKTSGLLGGRQPAGNVVTIDHGSQPPGLDLRVAQQPAPGMKRPPTMDPGRWQMVNLTLPEGPEGRAETIQLPAMERESFDPQWAEGAAVPAQILQAIKQSGHQIETRRELVPIEMQDGRRLVVPVDQVDVHFTRRPAL